MRAMWRAGAPRQLPSAQKVVVHIRILAQLHLRLAQVQRIRGRQRVPRHRLDPLHMPAPTAQKKHRPGAQSCIRKGMGKGRAVWDGVHRFKGSVRRKRRLALAAIRWHLRSSLQRAPHGRPLNPGPRCLSPCRQEPPPGRPIRHHHRRAPPPLSAWPARTSWPPAHWRG